MRTPGEGAMKNHAKSESIIRISHDADRPIRRSTTFDWCAGANGAIFAVWHGGDG
jgi:hypothetical protein